MADIYQLQAQYYANVPLMQRDIIASVHLEGDDDKAFWNKMLQSHHPGQYHFITYRRDSENNEAEGNSHIAHGVGLCLKYRPYLSKQFFICIDSDMHHLLKEPDFDASHYICQTYTYSWENHYCEAHTIQKRFMAQCPDRACQFDFEAFLSTYSAVVFKPLLLLLYCLRSHKSDFTRKQFDACLPHQCKGVELADNGKKLIERIANYFEPYLYTPLAKSIDFEAEKSYCDALNVNEQNAYLHIRGHNLFDLVASIGKMLCHGTSISFKEDILMNDLPPQTYWQIKKVAADISALV